MHVILGLTVLGLKFHEEVDLTAIGTLLLAAATFLALIFVSRSLKQTQAQIELGQWQLAATQEEIGFSRKEACLSRTDAEVTHRPAVVPVAGGEHVTLAGGEELPAGPAVPERGLLVVPIMNIGLGPALSVEATIEGLDPLDPRSPDPRLGPITDPRPLGAVTGMCMSEVMGLEAAINGLGEVPSFKLTLAYRDIAGKEWLTVATWVAENGRYVDLSIRSHWPRVIDPPPRKREAFRPSPEREREFAEFGLLPADRQPA